MPKRPAKIRSPLPLPRDLSAATAPHTASSNPGDLVVDPFTGSGTTLVVGLAPLLVQKAGKEAR